MLNNIYQLCSLRQLRIPFVGLVLSVGIVSEHSQPVLSEQIEKVPTSTGLVENNYNSSVTPVLNQLREVREQRNQQWADSEYSNVRQTPQQLKTVAKTAKVAIASQKSAKETVTLPKANFPKEDGVYLYGQSVEAEQLGQGYIIFDKRQGKVKGALYMPSSEYSCFEGTLEKSGELAMTVKALPDQGGLNEVATSNQIPRITDDAPTTYAYSVALEDYYQLRSISANDRRILQMCNQPAADEYRKLVK